MCEACGDFTHGAGTSRRGLLIGGSGLAAAPLMAMAGSANAQSSADGQPMDTGPSKVRAFAATSASSRFSQIEIDRRAVGPHDVLLDILYAGICHSDIHSVRGDWGPANYPIVPGHEIVGRVRAVGRAVTKFTVGDIGGVGCMVASCGTCENCLADREQNCVNGTTFTYDAPDKVSGGRTFGGYSDAVVVTEKFVIRMPPSVDLAAFTPILCAGVTTFSPMQHWELEPGQKIGVVGLGGLGHMAVKLAVARRAEVTVFTTSPGKVEDARRLGAKDAVLSTDTEAMKLLSGQFDLLISTVPEPYQMQPFIDTLKLDGTMVNVGALGPLQGGLSGMLMGFGRKSLAGSMIGGIAETQEVIDYCAARNIKADVEVITPDQIDRAYERVMAKDVRYRFVIDMSAGRKA
ncbi:NAD(P)-dependent alcohol dehydrogenase (plasmid) [Agrobacterium rosae]|uniref:NAD(P)-dependent alcohol dehydrogenase n=1 Tax=Agrobacterium rosae TaxID=1972867 RepID=A0ABU4W1Y7_9HYPH|nr:NAD(P)-dependent alcohol dehydrogenase [Agrobacterium rosae]MDX8331776.1 NAD(P)-dependent alcohol dehydrogenase [Agrobacterium rosae]